MNEATIRGNIKTALESISGIGQVYDYQRWATDWTKFLSLYKDSNGKINAWAISCEGISLEEMPWESDPADREFTVTYSYKIRGVFGVDDSAATEKTHLAKAIEVLDKLVGYGDSFGTSTFTPPLPSLDIYEYRMIGDVLCHYAEITQQITEIASV